jgi:hypothetical protein
MTPREEAALRVRTLHPPLPSLFAALRASLGAPSAPAAAPPAATPASAPATPEPPAAHRAPEPPAPPEPPPPAPAPPEPTPTPEATPASDPLDGAVHDGIAAARAAGVPVGDVDLPYARRLAAGDPARARNAGILAAVRTADGWAAAQRFGEPWCPSPGCYGRDGSLLDDAVPPFADDCNCRAEPTQVR